MLQNALACFKMPENASRWYMKYERLNIKYEIWNMKNEIWNMKYEIWKMKYEISECTSMLQSALVCFKVL